MYSMTDLSEICFVYHISLIQTIVYISLYPTTSHSHCKYHHDGCTVSRADVHEHQQQRGPVYRHDGRHLPEVQGKVSVVSAM